MENKLIVVILTYNESIHIERAIKNVSGWADKIVVIDSYSEDDTVIKSESSGAEIVLRKFDNYKNQREFAIQSYKDQTEWLLFLDADEYLTEDLKQEIKVEIKNQDVNGFYLPRRFIFMNRWIKWGGYYPTYLLRLFRPEYASLDRAINEHVVVTGNKKYLKQDFVDHNLKGITNWVEKHNRYAAFEAKELFHVKTNKTQYQHAKLPLTQSERKQWLRHFVWNKLPTVIVRPIIYFFYRYFFRLGFLDGKEGFIYHFLQGFWFWLIIDIKYVELKKTEICAE